MFEARYGRAVTAARDELAAATVEPARRIVELITDEPPRGAGGYPISAVLRALAPEQQALIAAVANYPLSVCLDTDGRVDALAKPLATLASTLAGVLVTYHGLGAVPDSMRGKLNADLRSLLAAANGIVNVVDGERGRF